MYSKKSYKKLQKARQSFHDKLEEYGSQYKNVTLNNNYYQFDRDLLMFELKVEKGKATDKEIEDMISKINTNKRKKNIPDFFKAYDVELDRFVDIKEAKLIEGKNLNIYSDSLVIEKNKLRPTNDEVNNNEQHMDYNNAIYESVLEYLFRKSPQGIVVDITRIIERMERKYKYENVCKVFELMQDEIPDLTGKVTYQGELLDLKNILEVMESSFKQLLTEYEQTYLNKQITQSIEEEDNYEV